MRISDFIEQSNQADSAARILGLMERATGDLGFDRFAYSTLGKGVDGGGCGAGHPPTVEHNFPSAWKERYVKHDYQSIDPVVLFAPEIEGPFLWESLKDSYHLDAKQIRLMRQASESGLKDGVSVPLHGPRSTLRLVSYAAGDGHPDPGSELAKLGVLATQFHSAYSTIDRSAKRLRAVVALSLRERECLQWIASGKSSWDIGMILSISENTVNFHVKNALAKLDANTRTLAVVKAIRYGLISL